jgi:hypothetical protein
MGGGLKLTDFDVSELKGAEIVLVGTAFQGQDTAVAFGLVLPSGKRRILVVHEADIFDPDSEQERYSEHYLDSGIRH